MRKREIKRSIRFERVSLGRWDDPTEHDGSYQNRGFIIHVCDH